MRHTILDLDPGSYHPHMLHADERDWAETNCYVDVWIELLHALGYEPIAALPFTFGIDFEGDQWTFFKFPISDLYDLFGLEIQELNIWQSLVWQVQEQVKLGRPVLVEMDSYYLPDTAGTSYQTAHVKTTIAVVDIDQATQHLGYFHGQGYYHLSGSDFANIFRLNADPADGWLPPYVEFAKLGRGGAPEGDALVERSVALLREHAGRRPAHNPVPAFRARFENDIGWLKDGSIEAFHQYSFATLRQLGACFELSGTLLRWLVEHGRREFDSAVSHFAQMSALSKTMQFNLARVVARKRDKDLTPALDDLERSWDAGMNELTGALR